MANQHAPTAPEQSWVTFFEQARQLASVDSDAVLALVARWADAREAEYPGSTLPLAAWLAEQLGLQPESQPGRPEF